MLINPCIITRTILTLHYSFVNNILVFLNEVILYISLTFILYNTLHIKKPCYNIRMSRIENTQHYLRV